jgi:hypothetical protein
MGTFGVVRIWWAAWSSRRHPALLLFLTALAAFFALILMLSALDTPIVLYKEF